MKLLKRWMDTNFKPGSPLSEMLKERLMKALFDVTMSSIRSREGPHRIFANDTSPVGAASSFSGIGYQPNTLRASGLEVLYPELHYMGENIANLAICHWRVYAYLYEADGFLA
jgi:hypothetical protein